MRSERGWRRRYTAAALVAGVVAVGCTGGGDDSAEETTTTTTSAEAISPDLADGLTLTFADWYNTVTSGDAAVPNCDDGLPVWVAAESLAPSSSGPLLVCADRTATDGLVLNIVNNGSGPLSIEYPDAVAGWELASNEPDGVTVLAGGVGALIRPGVGAKLTADAGAWDEQELSLVFAERWAIIEATSEVMSALGLENTFDWAADLAEACDVDTVADSDLGASLEVSLFDYFDCVFDGLGDAVDDADRQALTDIVPLVGELVERAKNVASQQRAGAVMSSLSVRTQLPEPAGPSIDPATTTSVVVTQPPTTRPPTTRPPTTRPPTTPAPTTAPPTSPSTTAVPTTTTTAPKKVTTTEEDPDLTVPLPPAPVLVALETVQAGVETYTAWPAIDPKLGRLPGGQIVVIECKAFSSSITPGGNGWWYRIGSGDTAGGWASATGFKNLVAGVANGSTSSSNVSDAVSDC